jgi:hypothetical protein
MALADPACTGSMVLASLGFPTLMIAFDFLLES